LLKAETPLSDILSNLKISRESLKIFFYPGKEIARVLRELSNLRSLLRLIIPLSVIFVPLKKIWRNTPKR